MEINENPGKTYFSVKKQHLIDMMKSDEELGLYEEPKQREMFLMNANEIIDTRKPKEEIYGWFLEALQKGANHLQENLIKELELRKSKEMNSFFREFYTETINLIKNMEKTSIINIFSETENIRKEIEKKMKDPRDEEIKDLKARLDYVKGHSTQVLKMIEDLEEQDKKKYSKEEVQVKLYECLGHFAKKHNIIINGVEIDSWCFEQLNK